MRKSCIITIMVFLCICLITGISVSATNKTSSDIWKENCQFVNGNRQSIEQYISPIIRQDISAEEKINNIKNYISSLYKDNRLDIEYVDVVIENIPNSYYVVTIEYSIKHCKKNEKIKFIIEKGVL